MQEAVEMKMRKLYLGLMVLLLSGCNLPVRPASGSTPGPAPVTETPSLLMGAAAEIPPPTPTAPALGTDENPLILALIPSASVDGARVSGGQALADWLTEITGYSFVVVSPETYANLVEALGRGDAHIAVLSPYAYALAYEQGYVKAAFASLRSGEKTYGAQFIARTDAGFTSYYDALAGENTADAATALSQFREKKPCWSEERSLSSHLIPAGVLAQNEIPTRSAAFLGGQPEAVLGVYAGGICDFGGTYIDARTFPSVRDAHPDVREQVSVIWRIPPVIPYENIVLAGSLPSEMAQAVQDAVFRIAGMQAGREVLKQAYGIDAWEPVDDAFYDVFRRYLQASGVDLESLNE